ncbi:MAG: hypothetical protein V4674_01855 [Patescibacteria group bacterium]
MQHDPWYFEKKITPKGIELWHKEMPELDWYGIGVIVFAGHRQDPAHLNNLSHFVEHCIVDAERPHWRTRGEREEYMLTHGIIESQGFATTVDYMWTAIKAVRATAGLSYLHDIFRLPPSAIDPEKPKRIVEREKKERGTDDERTIARAIWKNILPEAHPLVRYYDSAGVARMLEQVTLDDALTHWKNHYTHKNTVLVSIGKISATEMAQLVDLYFVQDADEVGMGERYRAVPLIETDLPRPKELHLHVSEILGHHHYDKNISPEVLVLRPRALPHVSNAARYMLKRTLGSSLFERLREQKKLVYSAPVRNELYQDIAIHRLTMNCGREQVNEILAETKRLRMIVEEEGREIFEREKREALLGLDLEEETASSLLADAMYDLALHGKIELKLQYLEQLHEVTFEQTLAAVEDCFGEGKATILSITPD